MIIVKSPLALGSLLRETRTAMNIPAADLAAMVSTTPVTLRRLEQGKPTVAISTLFTLLDELGLELHVSVPPGITLIESGEQSKPRRTRVKS
jgi:transcriptional regulator with XRE-family HTH domain